MCVSGNYIGMFYRKIILDFERIGYTVEAKILNTADYGVPQVRKRVFFIGSKVKKNIIFQSLTRRTTHNNINFFFINQTFNIICG
jgi:site-specific DNA-cytosine methylase